MAEKDQEAPKETEEEEKARKELEEKQALMREHLTRFAAVANTGGVVAVITTFGAVSKGDEVANILALPLALFSLGVICALLSVVNASALLMGNTGNMDRSVPLSLEAVKEEVSPGNKYGYFLLLFLMRKSFDFNGFFMFGMILFFVLGCITGVWIVACA